MSGVRLSPRWVAGSGLMFVLGLSVLLVDRSLGAVAIGVFVVATGAAVVAVGRAAVTTSAGTRPGTDLPSHRREPALRQGTAAIGAIMSVALLLLLLDRRLDTAGLVALAAAVAAAGLLFAPLVARAARRAAPALVALALLAAVIVLVGREGIGSRIGFGGLWLPLSVFAVGSGGVCLVAAAPGIGQGAAAGSGAGVAPPSERQRRRSSTLWQAVLGSFMILWAIGIAIALAQSYVAYHPALVALSAVAVVLAAALVIAVPLALASYAGRQRLAAERTREAERQRIAAHLHDSVLQTLALVQRQAEDPGAVARLARRQESALRAWMSGEADLNPAALSASLRLAVRAIEDAHELSIEFSVIGDRPTDTRDEALVGAMGEALRNAARHARGSPVTVFAEVDGGLTEVFVSDAGPGFELASVPRDRRGIRDSILARMASVGGVAEITSEPGQGTDVLLRLPAV